MKNYRNGEHFLSEIYPNMQHEEIVNNHTTKSDTKEDKIGKYLKRLENAHDNTNEHKIKLLKELYYQKYIIKELPQGYIELQERIYKEQGYGNIKIDENMKQELLKVVQKDQKDSLDLWIDYLISEDAMYPTWFKYYIFNGMITLGKYDKENNKFQKRDEKTVEKFLEINREVIANVYDAISKEIGKNEITDEVKKALEQGESFKKLYLHFLRNNKTINYISNEGIWKKYKKGTDSKILCDSLQGKNTGWCTAGYETAKTQLEQGDFYVYYTKDEIGEYTNPRIAIRMKNDRIAEVRGVANNQNLEPEMNDIAEKKLNEFPDKEEYLKKVSDMKLLTKIDNKVKQGLELTVEELRFLYEIDERIKGFGYRYDPRVKQIRNLRSLRKDLSIIFDCAEELVGIEFIDKFESGKYKVWYGDIITPYIDFYDSKIILPEIVVFGDVTLESSKSAENLVLPIEIIGDLTLNNLKSAEGLVLPKKLNNLQLDGIESAEGLVLPEEIFDCLSLANLKNIEGLVLPKKLGGLYLENLKSAEGLVLPKKLKFLRLDGIESAKGLVLPEEITWDLSLNGLKSAEGLVLPKKLHSLYLDGIESAKGLVLPEEITWDLSLKGLKSAEGLVLPKKIVGDLVLSSLTVEDKLILPESLKNTSVYTNATIEYIPNEEYYNRNTKKR